MLKKISIILTLVLFALLPFNAIVTNYIRFELGFDVPINVWKEIIVVLLTILVGIDFFMKKRKVHFDRLDWLIVCFFALGILSAVFQTKEIGRILYGFKYDFEFLWLFLVLRHSTFFGKKEIQKCLKTILASGSIVLLFGILQTFILPKNFMTIFGYSENISSWLNGDPLPMYHGIGANLDIVRTASTLSGPNQFGMYTLILLFTGLVFAVKKKQKVWWWIFSIAAVINLISTFSRSALLGAIVAAFLGLFLVIQNKKYIKRIILYGILLLTVILSGLSLYKPIIIESVLQRASSTQGHYERSYDGIVYTLKKPLGHGIGNAGPASTRFQEDRIGWLPENWYLQVSLQLGILGALLFLSIIFTTMQQLYHQHKNNVLATSFLLSLIAISIACLFLHAWEESAVALTFWGMAGILLQHKNKLQTQ